MGFVRFISPPLAGGAGAVLGRSSLRGPIGVRGAGGHRVRLIQLLDRVDQQVDHFHVA
jgi:hypothetical protein